MRRIVAYIPAAGLGRSSPPERAAHFHPSSSPLLFFLFSRRPLVRVELLVQSADIIPKSQSQSCELLKRDSSSESDSDSRNESPLLSGIECDDNEEFEKDSDEEDDDDDDDDDDEEEEEEEEEEREVLDDDDEFEVRSLAAS